MKVWIPILIGLGVCLLATFENCSGGFKSAALGSSGQSLSSSSTDGSGGGALSTASKEANVLPLCTGTCGFATKSINQTFVSVTLCEPGTNVCTTINNIVLDTSSVGLRVFAAGVTGLTLPNVTDAKNNELAECVFATATQTLFGPVKSVDVVLGGEAAVNVPVQIIDSTYSNGKGAQGCTAANMIPSALVAGANGVLGIGFLPTDCSNGVCTNANSYAICPNNVCGALTEPVDLNLQVANPLYFLDQDNNGFSIQMGAALPGGSASVSGTLTLGINTRANNAPGAVTTLPVLSDASTSAYGSVSAVLAGGAPNMAYFTLANPTNAIPTTALTPACTGSGLTSYLCPAQELTLALVLGSSAKTISTTIAVGNSTAELSATSSSTAFDDLTSPSAGPIVLGTSFFLGRTIYFGLDSQPSLLGTGPYVAF